ncbi:MAG: hypothetical protein ACTS80_00790 [Candidatus Hodgkinia cicadicola]
MISVVESFDVSKRLNELISFYYDQRRRFVILGRMARRSNIPSGPRSLKSKRSFTLTLTPQTRIPNVSLVRSLRTFTNFKNSFVCSAGETSENFTKSDLRSFHHLKFQN